VHSLVAAEGPIHAEAVTRRVLAAWQVARQTDRSRALVEQAIDILATAGSLVVRGDFLWPPGLDPEAWPGFRAPPPGGVAREAAEIPIEEIAGALAWVLAQNLALDRADLLRQAARAFGIARVGPRVADRLDEAIRWLADRRRCAIDGERVRWLG
jgi:hypothetical protein